MRYRICLLLINVQEKATAEWFTKIIHDYSLSFFWIINFGLFAYSPKLLNYLSYNYFTKQNFTENSLVQATIFIIYLEF